MSELPLDDGPDISAAARDAARGHVVYLTEHGERLAAIVPAEFAAVLEGMTRTSVERIAADHRAAGLDEVDVAVMDLAGQVADDATSVGEADLRRLRDLGLAQEEVMDVILAAAARCFFSKTLDALGVRPDPGYRDLEPGLRQVLVVGRPIADG